MNIGLKICGMKHRDNVLEIGKLQPDYIGFNFYKQSPRFVGDNFQIPPDLNSAAKKVGVFVDEDADVVVDLAEKHSLEFAQLHGNEPAEYCNGLHRKGIGVIKVFSVDDNFDFSTTEPFKGVADYFLFDTKGKYRGGNASRFNWDILHQYNQSVPFFLAGGITPTDISRIKDLGVMNLHALDVNSGVELSPGVKDIRLVKEVVRELKKYNDEISG